MFEDLRYPVLVGNGYEISFSKMSESNHSLLSLHGSGHLKAYEIHLDIERGLFVMLVGSR
jgi:hypothetical protein